MPDRVAVLGRGMSLQLYRDYSQLFKLIYIVNNFNADVSEVGIRHLKKKIVHVASRKGPNHLTKRTYKRLGIKRVQSNAFKTNLIENRKKFHVKPRTMPKCMEARGYPPIGWRKLYRGDTEGKRQSPNKRCWPTTGLMAIDLALTENKLKEIYLFGFDFYDSPYLTGKQTLKKDPYKIKMMRKHMETLVQEYSNTQFYCASKYKVDAPNWHNVGPVEENWAMVPTGKLIWSQRKLGRFNRMDIIMRYLAIENYYGKNKFGWKIYCKAQKIRLKDNLAGAKKSKGEFIRLIKSVETEGYKYVKPIRIHRNGRLLNGSHRLAVALYFKVKEVLVWKDSAKKNVTFNIKWFRKNKFKGKYIKALARKQEQLEKETKGG